jgi:hypothetical protein
VFFFRLFVWWEVKEKSEREGERKKEGERGREHKKRGTYDRDTTRETACDGAADAAGWSTAACCAEVLAPKIPRFPKFENLVGESAQHRPSSPPHFGDPGGRAPVTSSAMQKVTKRLHRNST